MPSKEEVLEFMKTNDLKWVDLHFVNMDGVLKHRTVAGKNFGEEAFADGVESDLAEVFGPEGNGVSLMPDPDSFARIPWEPNTMRIIANIFSMPGRERFMKDSRYFIERVNINAKAMGIGEVEIGSECEFYIFDNVTGDKTSPERGPNYLVDTREAYWNPSPFWNAKKGAFLSQPHDTLYAARVQIAEIMDEHFRYAIDSHSHGRSPNSQQSLRIREYNAKLAADALITLKYVARNIAFIAGNVATFMPFPIANDVGNSLRITQKIRKGPTNAFHDAKGDYALSQTALYYIGGILEHAEALSIFTAPTTNSYRRYRMNPRYAAWGRNSPDALLSVSHAKEEEPAVVYAGADPSVNPYLAYAAVVAAGLDGIKNKTDPGKRAEGTIMEMDAKKMKELKIRALPNSIDDALSALESDNKFLKGFISPELLEEYLEQRLAEQKENEKMPTAFEMERYFNR